ncbi:MAG: chloride channel protein [Muribaculaceae bacterium]|nr:chloride channel protein [Muribaculaceae bacterium]
MNLKPRIYFIAALVGVLAGLFCFGLKTGIRWVAQLATYGIDWSASDWRLIFLPVVGVILADLYATHIARRQLAHGTHIVESHLDSGNYVLPAGTTYQPLVGTVITLGLGGSAGAEGPIALAGAAIGSNVGRRFGFDSSLMRLFVACGAGAGIAAVFKAPIGGFLFTLEVLGMQFATAAVMAVFVATLMAALTMEMLTGFSFSFSYPDIIFPEWSFLPWVLLLGIVVGVYTLFYRKSIHWIISLLSRFSSHWVRNIVSGLIIGIPLFIFPCIYGEGYPAMNGVLESDFTAVTKGSPLASLISSPWILLAFVGGIALLKGIVTSSTNNGGGVAGIFAPTLFAGCFVGLSFALLIKLLFPVSLPVAPFAFMGMAGVMSAHIKAPFMAMFLTSEMCGDFRLFLPSAVVSLVAYGFVWYVNHRRPALNHC